jgi:hypothetical protein
MKKEAMSKGKAARALKLLAEEHLRNFAEEERVRRIMAFAMKVPSLKRCVSSHKSASSDRGL